MKAVLIALAALTIFDAAATGGRYRTELTHACIVAANQILDLGWSMTRS